MVAKRIWFIALLVLLACKSYGQIYKDFNKLHHVYELWALGGCDTLYYTEKISPSALDTTIKLISSNKTFELFVLYMGKDTEQLTLTNDEQAYLIAELNKLKSFVWPAKMFPKSKRIKVDQLSSAFAVTHKYPQEKYVSCSVISSFSKPIFLRNGKICLYIDQEIFSETNTRVSAYFFTRVDGQWEEYAEVYTQDNDFNIKPDTALDEMTANLLKAQIQQDAALSNRLEPETLSEFGKRVFLRFQSGNLEEFNSLFPTLEQRVVLANELGMMSRRNPSKEELELNHIMSLLRFNNDCHMVLEAAKTLKVDWTKANYSSAITSETQTPVKDKAGTPLSIKNVGIEFNDGPRKFYIDLKGAFLINKVWKVLSVEGIEERTIK